MSKECFSCQCDYWSFRPTEDSDDVELAMRPQNSPPALMTEQPHPKSNLGIEIQPRDLAVEGFQGKGAIVRSNTWS